VIEDIASICVTRSTILRDALATLDRSGAGLLLLVDGEGQFERTVTDGDLRRLLLKSEDLSTSIADLPEIHSLTIGDAASRKDALALMDTKGVNHLPVIDAGGKVLRVLDRREIDKQILLSTPHMGDTELHFVEEAFRTNWIAPLGPNVDAFEREIAELVGVRHGAALSSGTAALHLALRLVGVGQGDRVFCSSFTFAASANPIVYQGAEPVFIDSDHESWNMSVTALERAFAEAKAEGWMPKAVMVVNLYGQSADYDPILELCAAHGVPVIEDAAESLGARYKGKPSGTFGVMAAFSFNGNKIITTSGGGMLVSDDEQLITKARFLSTQARDPAPHYQHSEIGFNYRMSNILAGVGRGQLQVLQDRVDARRGVYEAYRTGLSDIPGIVWMPEPEWSYSTHWLSTCTIDEAQTGISAQALLKRLADEFIETRPLWKPMHLQPVFEGCRYFPHGNTSVSDELFETGLCLPSGSNMSAAEIERIVGTVRKVIGEARA
jgi:dTDP-4-amino-4,6-dideoxygalactose transaminase